METEIDRKEEMHAEPRSEWGAETGPNQQQQQRRVQIYKK